MPLIAVINDLGLLDAEYAFINAAADPNVEAFNVADLHSLLVAEMRDLLLVFERPEREVGLEHFCDLVDNILLDGQIIQVNEAFTLVVLSLVLIVVQTVPILRSARVVITVDGFGKMLNEVLVEHDADEPERPLRSNQLLIRIPDQSLGYGEHWLFIEEVI